MAGGEAKMSQSKVLLKGVKKSIRGLREKLSH